MLNFRTATTGERRVGGGRSRGALKGFGSVCDGGDGWKGGSSMTGLVTAQVVEGPGTHLLNSASDALFSRFGADKSIKMAGSQEVIAVLASHKAPISATRRVPCAGILELYLTRVFSCRILCDCCVNFSGVNSLLW